MKKKDDVVVIPKIKIEQVIIDPKTNSTVITFVEGHILVMKGNRVILQSGKNHVMFHSFDEFKTFVDENTGLKLLPGGREH